MLSRGIVLAFINCGAQARGATCAVLRPHRVFGSPLLPGAVGIAGVRGNGDRRHPRSLRLGAPLLAAPVPSG